MPMIFIGSAATAGMSNAQSINARGAQNRGKLPIGFSMKKRVGDASRKNNIDKLRATSSKINPEGIHYKPKVSEDFLADWLDFPVDVKFPVLFNTGKLWLTWLIWTTRAMAGLDPGDTSIRSRVCSQVSVLGTAAGLFLVIAIAGFLVPPAIQRSEDKIWLNIFGCIMFTAALCLIYYIGIALTGFYPLVESLRDDVAFDAFENYQKRVGNAEVYFFFVGMHLVLVALLVAAKILYWNVSLYIMLGVTVLGSAAVLVLSRQIFLALDPISSMHMGLSNDPEQHYRAELMSHFILRKVPNSLLGSGDDNNENDLFIPKRESVKLQRTRESQKIQSTAAAAAVAVSAEQGDEKHLYSPMKSGTIHAGAAGSAGQDGDTEMGVDDAVTTVLPFSSARTGKFSTKNAAAMVVQSVESEADVGTTASHAQTRSIFPDLRTMFCSPKESLFTRVGLGMKDSTAAYELLVKARCGSTEELLRYLSETKRHQACSCGVRGGGSGGGSGGGGGRGGVDAGHSADCASRSAGVWMEGLVAVDIPHFTAMKIVQGLREQNLI